MQDFKLGMDRSKVSRVSGLLGTAWTIKNAHITRGGDIERMKKFVKQGADFHASTKGLFSIRDTLYTVGYSSAYAASIPAGVTHILTQHPTPATVLTEVLDAEPFDGRLYSISRFQDGNVYHFYNTARVTDWDTLSTSISSNNAVASALSTAVNSSAAVNTSVSTATITVTSATAGTPFTLTTATVNNGSVNDQTLVATQTQANVVAVAEVLASGTITITGGTASAGVNKVTSITVNGVDILGAAVDWVTSNSVTAVAVQTQINSYTSSPEYAITVVGAILTIKPLAGTGASVNGFVIVVNVAGDVTASTSGSLASGVTAVAAVAQIYTVVVGGTFESADQFTIYINTTEEYIVTGRSSGTGTSVLTFKKKLYSTATSNLYFCALNAPTQWISGTDYGFINISSETAGQEDITATAEYQGLMAIFSENQTRIWSISEDSADNVSLQTLQNTGTIAPKSVLSYGNNDVFFLAASGVRSLRARDSSNSASVSDVGSSIDSHIVAYMATLTDEQIAASRSIIEPIDGRFLLAIPSASGTRVYIFSYFPSKKISAWSYYDLSIIISDFAKVGNRIYARATDAGVAGLYLYGGTNNDTYPSANETPPVLELPYLSANAPAAFKELKGFDIVGTNNWTVTLLPDPYNTAVTSSLGISSGVSLGKPRFGVSGVTSLFALTLTCLDAGAATISALAMHYTGKFEDG